MHPAIRTQVDGKQAEFSRLAETDTSDQPDLTRQEFREEADANALLARFGVNVPQARIPQFGDNDFDLDLHSAYIAVDRAHHAFIQLAPELREKYGTPAGMLDAMNSGELETDLRAQREKETAPSPAPVKRTAKTPPPPAEEPPPPPPPADADA